MDTSEKGPPLSSYASLRHLELTNNSDVPSTPQSQEALDITRRISGARTDITLALTYILVPSLALSSLLIGLVIGNRVHTHQSEDGSLSFMQMSNRDADAYYVDYNATSLATIASWTSTIGPILAFSVMTLASFPIARKLQDNSMNGSTDLPTPFQLSMLFQTLNTNIASFWTLFLYRKWNHKEGFPSMLRAAFYFLLLAFGLNLIVAAVDTWFHLAVTTSNLDVVSFQIPIQSYGRGIANASCGNQHPSNFSTQSCSIKTTHSALGSSNWLIGADQAYWTLTNLSTINTVRTMARDGLTFAFLAPATLPDSLDYQASTMAISTQCEPASRRCDLHVDSNGAEPFHCSQGFRGDLSVPEVDGNIATSGSFSSRTGVVFYRDKELNVNASLQASTQNPYFLGVWAVLELEPSTPQLENGEVIQTPRGGTSWVLNCTTAVYDLSYSWVKGTGGDSNLTLANSTMATLMNSPIWYGFGGSTLEDIAYAASAENNTQRFAESWARGYSTTVVGLSAGFMSARRNILEQERQTILVARVPKAPFYCLITLNYLYVILAAVLAYYAIKSKPNETNDVRERLTMSGLVAFCFEGTRAKRAVEAKKHMFAEHHEEDSGRVGLERSEHGGWEYMRRHVK